MSAGAAGRSVVVAGFGITGRAVAAVLGARGDRVVVVDDSPPAGEGGVIPMPSGAGLESLLAGCDLLVPSPGIPVGHPLISAARLLGVPVVSEIELAAGLWGASGPKIAAVTGTNGKTTVTTLATAMLERSGIKAVAAGNIGSPMIEAAQTDPAVVVAEVSSFQLEFTDRFHPVVACWLNFAPDHLDWHPSMEHYRSAKERIWRNQGPGDVVVVNEDDPIVSSAASSVPAGVRRIGFSVSQASDYRVDGPLLVGPDGLRLVEIASLPRALPHDLANSLAASAVALAAGASAKGCRAALESVEPLPHRVSFAGSGGGVTWYDDSKATTPASVLAAVAGFESVVLIAGGRNKGLDLSVLGATVPPVHAVVAIGEATGEIVQAFDGKAQVVPAGDMAGAVAAAARLARRGDAVLLSPGCASFDWYRSYAARGDDFVANVREMLDKGGNQW